MSKEEVPGEKRTVSPSRAATCARSTASPNDDASSHSVASRQSFRYASRDLANQDRVAHFAGDERRDRIESETLVLAAGDQHDRFGRAEERFFERIEIGRLRVVDVIDAANRADELQAMQLRRDRRKAAAPSPRRKVRAPGRRRARPSCFRRCAGRANARRRAARQVAAGKRSSRRLTKSRRRSSRH